MEGRDIDRDGEEESVCAIPGQRREKNVAHHGQDDNDRPVYCIIELEYHTRRILAIVTAPVLWAGRGELVRGISLGFSNLQMRRLLPRMSILFSRNGSTVRQSYLVRVKT